MEDLVSLGIVEQALLEGQRLAIELGPRLVAAVLVFLVGKRVARVLARLAERAMTRARVDPMLTGFAGNLIYVALFAFVVLAALNQLGVQTTSFIAVVGAAGLAVGLALQGSLSNFAAGVMLIFFRPFKVGDFIEAGGTMGTVEQIMLFTTRMRTGDNKQVFVPNGQIIGGIITNFSGNPTRRVDMVFGCAYGDDLRKVRAVLEELVAADPRVLPDPAPVVAVGALNESSVDFIVRPWVKSEDYWSLYWDFQERVKQRFDEEGLSIPFPQREVHLHEAA
jgi:small conductance mechanosensitive channel